MTSGNKGVQLSLEYRFSICLVENQTFAKYSEYSFRSASRLRKKERRKKKEGAFFFRLEGKEGTVHDVGEGNQSDGRKDRRRSYCRFSSSFLFSFFSFFSSPPSLCANDDDTRV